MANPNPPPPPKEYQFKPGQSGNPAGRPPGSLSLVSMLKEKLAECPEGTDKKTYAQLLIQRSMNIALLGGDVSMIRDIFNRIDGMPKGALDLTSNGNTIAQIVSETENK